MVGFWRFSGTSCYDGLGYDLSIFYPPAVYPVLGAVYSGTSSGDYYTVTDTGAIGAPAIDVDTSYDFVSCGAVPSPTPTTTPTETPTPTVTRTPTPTPWGGCVDFGTTFFGTQSSPCGGGDDTIETLTVVLYDSPGGNIINAPTNISVTVDGSSSSSCPDYNGPIYFNLTILAGNSQASQNFVSSGSIVCPIDSTCDGYTQSASNISSVSPAQFQICANITPSQTPSPTVTPTLTLTSTPCYCTSFSGVVSTSDTNLSTGNTNTNLDNVLVWKYTDCTNTSGYSLLLSAGTYTDLGVCACSQNGLFYTQNDVEYQVTGFTSLIVPTFVPCINPTPTITSTETPTPTPTLTPTITPTITETPTNTPTNTNTPTITETPTQTPTITPTVTPTITETPTQTPTITPTVTPTITETVTPTITQTNTETPTQTPTPTTTTTPTTTITPTITDTPTQTPTPTITPTITPTTTITPTVTQTTATVIQFRDCSNGSNVFRFGGSSFPVISNDEVYYISGGDDFVGCATVETNDGSGPLYNALGVTFTFVDNCIHPLCPRTSEIAALLINCRTEEVFYATVDEDTAFDGAAYQYNGECYAFVEFSGEGGPYLGSPDFKDCPACLAAVITPTPPPTPTITPTVSLTPSVCSETDFSINTTLYPFSNYNGNYEISSNYNGRPSYTAETTTAYIYFFTSVTESYWCLSDTLGGSCVLRGASPCNSICPDISLNYFNTGRLGTPTPTPSNCQIDFVAYFDCDYNPTPTPTVSIDCNDTSISVTSVILTPTPTPSKTACGPKAVQFTITGTPGNAITLTPTPSPTRTPNPFNVNLGGAATFNVLNNSFTCPVSKVLKNCDDTTELFTCASLLYNGSQLAIGTYFSANINGRNLCVQYIADTTNTASNSNVFAIYNIFQDCSYCVQVATPTPTSTITPTITPTTTVTPTITPTNSVTPTVTRTPGLTQSPTPSVTSTITPTNSLTPTITPTMSPTPNYVYVFRSCFQDLNGITQEIIQTSPLPFTVNTNELIRSNLSAPNECWTYKGRFNSNYLPPPNTQPTTFNGNYFAGINQITYSSCTDCFNSGCVRPPELIPIILNNYFDDDRVSPRRTYNFNSFADACFYLNEFFSPSCTSSSLCGIGGGTGYVVSLIVGSYVYGNSGCNYFPDGIYITDLVQGIVVEIINGQINSIQSCL